VAEERQTPERRDLVYLVRRVAHGVVRHRTIDAAASLTFFSALAVFPSALAVVSIVALADDRDRAVGHLLDVARELAPGVDTDALRVPLEQLLSIDNPGVGLALGLVLALWTGSGYATGFGRAVNDVYEVVEGRRPTLVRLRMLGVAAVLLVAMAGIIGAVLVTPEVADAVAAVAGVPEPWTLLWDIGKWPIVLALVAVVVSLLFSATPNVRPDRPHWIGLGTFVAVVIAAGATAGFVIYVVNLADYGRLYGWLGGGIVLLLWLYLVNLSLMVGAEADAELVRYAQLREGLAAESQVRLERRSIAREQRMRRAHQADLAAAAEIRARASGPRDPALDVRDAAAAATEPTPDRADEPA
jgi:membrane protein